jgi:hypothetical protein
MSIPAILASESGNELLADIAFELGVEPDTLLELVSAADTHSGRLRRKGMFQAFDAILGGVAH